MLHPKMRKLFIGVDIHKRTHVAVIINCFTEKLGELRFENNKKGFEKLIEFVKSHLKRGISPCFGLEDTSGNGQMLKMEKPDLILVFHEDLVKSKGARDMFLITWIILGLYINIIISA